ncbi:hypothetical protein TVAG_260030 [Trichomonas vaginalis G3]|uniref:receptor protein-tyrosine kinase n=1 Tax=Trichomonas vaginalis (strain ATCC PRA-98 / G3) TaxID=412133 RepID=A2E8T6_TRIV3|nr:glycine-rich protein family [Trichomonas vaginalis G3]EAY10918.1 hypothetical protein TVAG_260030 [Trichomonas vaginalis G3]KAI5485543.1 glycine-rich protein family [Trichomonas vaginalis G3]|eukprot:XP_001323141.1 hypothetical protein [Trichomonas vaginalis G3]
MLNLRYSLRNSTRNSFLRVKRKSNVYLFEYPCDSRTYCEPYEIELPVGECKVELWGSSGGDARVKNKPQLIKRSGGNGSYVSGIIHISQKVKLYLYLGGQGEDQASVNELQNASLGGWNFEGKGGIDTFEYHDVNKLVEERNTPPENGAGGGGAVDLRLYYYDINSAPIDKDELRKSIESRIIVAGSGGGADSGEKPYGYPGGKLSAKSLTPYLFGGNQTNGDLGVGADGISSDDNQGASGGHGSGFRGGYNTFDKTKTTGSIFEWGGTGGSSYISGHFGCISPNYPPGTEPNQINNIHSSKFYFTNTVMKSGDEAMPDPFSDDFGIIIGHVGNGICRITFLVNPFCQTCYTNFPMSWFIYTHIFMLVCPSFDV